MGEKFDTITGWTRAARVEITVVSCGETVFRKIPVQLNWNSCAPK
jgi:hypothetical protein